MPRRLHWPPAAPAQYGWPDDPDLDMGPVELRQVLVIASTPRVASNFFDAALAATGRAGHPLEYLNGGGLVESRRRTGAPRLTQRGKVQNLKRRLAGDPRWDFSGELDPTSLVDHLRGIAARRSTANGVFGVKVHAGHLLGLLDRYGLSVDLWGVPVRWVRLRRRDRLAQAVSLAVAHQTQQWRPVERQRGEPTYDLSATRAAMAEIEAWESVWDRRLGERSEPKVSFWSEDLVVDPTGAVDRTLALLGEVPVPGAGVPPVEQYRHPDRVMRQRWIERAMEESPDLAERRFALGGATVTGNDAGG